MKKTRLIVCGLLLTVFLLLVGFSGVKTNATGLTTDANLTVEGASVRTTDPLGLRFVAKTGEFDKTKATAYGIVLAFGEVADLNELVIGGKVNGKTVANGEVTELNEFGTFAVTLIGEVDVNPLPEALYAQKITARAYVNTADGVVYGATATTRSLFECALAAKKDGNTSEVLTNVLKYVDDNYVLVGKNIKDNLSVKTDFVVDNYKKLATEFVTDWNAKFGTKLTTVGYSFHMNAQANCEANSSKNTNLYKFFNEEPTKDKWGWFVEYLLSRPDCDIHPTRQLKSLLSPDGTASDGFGSQMNKLDHLLYSIRNFFNNDSNDYGYNIITYGNLNKYDTLKNYSKILINLAEYDLYKVNDTLTLDDVVAKNGYEFKGYTVNGVALEGLTYKLENKDVEIVPAINAINYTITFKDGETNLESTVKTFTVNDEVTLPVINKEGASFVGWYEDAEFTKPVSKIAKGTTGNKTYYAKYETAKTSDITFDYNDALTNTEIVQEFVDDVKALSGYSNFLSPSTALEHDLDIDFKPMEELLVKGKITPEFKAKWQWLLNYVGDAVLGLDPVPWANSQYGPRVKKLFDGTLSGATLNTTIYVLTQTLKGFRDSAKYDEGSIKGYDFSVDAKGFNTSIPAATKSANKTVTLVAGATIAEVPTKAGYTFDGWYNGDVKVTVVPDTNVTLVAKWIKK